MKSCPNSLLVHIAEAFVVFPSKGLCNLGPIQIYTVNGGPVQIDLGTHSLVGTRWKISFFAEITILSSQCCLPYSMPYSMPYRMSYVAQWQLYFANFFHCCDVLVDCPLQVSTSCDTITPCLRGRAEAARESPATKVRGQHWHCHSCDVIVVWRQSILFNLRCFNILYVNVCKKMLPQQFHTVDTT